MHRLRDRLVKGRTALVNQIRGLLAEYCIVINKGVGAVRRDLPLILEDAENGLTVMSRESFNELLEELRDIDERHAQCERKILMINQFHEVCQRLNDILDVGPVIVTAVYAAAGDGKDFVNDRHFSAGLGAASALQWK